MSPDRRYVAGSSPPTLVDRLISHYAEMVVAILGIILGPLLVGGWLMPMRHPVPALTGMGPLLTFTIAASLFVGSILWAVSLLRHYDDFGMMWGTMRLGMSLAGMGWFIGATTALVVHPEWSSTWITSYGVATVCGVGVWSTVVTERRIRRMVNRTDLT